MVATKGLSDRVQFLGYVDNPELGTPILVIQTVPRFLSNPIIPSDSSCEEDEEIENLINNIISRIDYSMALKNYVNEKFFVEQMLVSYKSLDGQI